MSYNNYVWVLIAGLLFSLVRNECSHLSEIGALFGLMCCPSGCWSSWSFFDGYVVKVWDQTDKITLLDCRDWQKRRIDVGVKEIHPIVQCHLSVKCCPHWCPRTEDMVQSP